MEGWGPKGHGARATRPGGWRVQWPPEYPNVEEISATAWKWEQNRRY